MACVTDPSGTPMIGKCCETIACAPWTSFPTRRYAVSVSAIKWLEAAAPLLPWPNYIQACLGHTLFQAAPGTGSVTQTIDPITGIISGVVPETWAIDHSKTIKLNCVGLDYLVPQGISLFNSLAIDASPPSGFLENTLDSRYLPGDPAAGGDPLFGPEFPFASSNAQEGLAGCVIGRFARTEKLEWSLGLGIQFVAVKGIMWLWGRYQVDVFQIAEPNPDHPATQLAGWRRVNGRRLTSTIYNAPPLVMSGGVPIWPQPEMVPVIFNPLPETEIVVYALT